MRSRLITRPAPAPVTLTEAATIAVPAGNGSHFRVTLTDDRTLGKPTGLTDGQRLLFEIIQGSGGSHALTLDSAYVLGSEISSVTLSTTEGARDFLGAIYNATTDELYVIALATGYGP